VNHPLVFGIEALLARHDVDDDHAFAAQLLHQLLFGLVGLFEQPLAIEKLLGVQLIEGIANVGATGRTDQLLFDDRGASATTRQDLRSFVAIDVPGDGDVDADVVAIGALEHDRIVARSGHSAILGRGHLELLDHDVERRPVRQPGKEHVGCTGLVDLLLDAGAEDLAGPDTDFGTLGGVGRAAQLGQQRQQTQQELRNQVGNQAGRLTHYFTSN
jgi:hypothetical protein